MTIHVASLVIVVSAVLVLSCRHTDTHTQSHTYADDRYTHATAVGVSKDKCSEHSDLERIRRMNAMQ